MRMLHCIAWRYFGYLGSWYCSWDFTCVCYEVDEKKRGMKINPKSSDESIEVTGIRNDHSVPIVIFRSLPSSTV